PTAPPLPVAPVVPTPVAPVAPAAPVAPVAPLAPVVPAPVAPVAPPGLPAGPVAPVVPVAPEPLPADKAGIHKPSRNVSWTLPPLTAICRVVPYPLIACPSLALMMIGRAAACSVTSWITTWSWLTAYGSSVTMRGTDSTRYASTPKSVVKSALTRSVWYGDPRARLRATLRTYHTQVSAG